MPNRYVVLDEEHMDAVIKKIPLLSMKILYRGIFTATFKRTYIQDQARPIIVTSLLSYETSPYFSWREKSLLPKILSKLEPCPSVIWIRL